MKLYLSSYRIPTPEDLYELVGKTADISAAAITNAKDYRDSDETTAKLDLLVSDLGEIGVTPTFINLRNYRDGFSVGRELSKYDLVYGVGGNNFNLMQAMKVSGFWKCIGKILDSGIVYVGESAGAIVMGPTLKGFETMDALNEVKGEPVWEGLGLVDRVIIPHADSPEYRDRVEPMVHLYPDAIVLNDNQAFIVDGSEQRIVTGA